MIQDRWDAYQTKNWPVFRHLKDKVRAEIKRAKSLRSDRVLQKDRNIWSVVRDLQGKREVKSFVTHAKDQQLLVNAITECFKSNFNSTSDAEPCLLRDEDLNPFQLSLIHI